LGHSAKTVRLTLRRLDSKIPAELEWRHLAPPEKAARNPLSAPRRGAILDDEPLRGVSALGPGSAVWGRRQRPGAGVSTLGPASAPWQSLKGLELDRTGDRAVVSHHSGQLTLPGGSKKVLCAGVLQPRLELSLMKILAPILLPSN